MHGEDVFMDLAREMWRSCGMRVVVLAGWKNEKGELVTYTCVFHLPKLPRNS